MGYLKDVSLLRISFLVIAFLALQVQTELACENGIVEKVLAKKVAEIKSCSG